MKLRRTLDIYQNNETLRNATIGNNTSTKRCYISRSVKKPPSPNRSQWGTSQGLPGLENTHYKDLSWDNK